MPTKRAKHQKQYRKSKRVPNWGPSRDERQFRWTTKEVDLDSDFGWQDIDLKKLCRDILPKLQAFERWTWGELVRTDDHHFVSPSDIIRPARYRLEVLLEDEEVGDVFSLRLTGKERIWGIETDGIYRILWWDPRHKINPSRKRHT